MFYSPSLQIQSYVEKQCSDLLHGTAKFGDYIISKEYRGISNYRPGAIVPSLVLARCDHVTLLSTRSSQRVSFDFVEVEENFTQIR